MTPRDSRSYLADAIAAIDDIEFYTLGFDEDMFHNVMVKLLAIDLLKTSTHGRGIVHVPITKMREIAEHRNKVAHGHFDQDPHSGDYEIVGKRRCATYSTERLDRLAAEANEAWMALRHSEAIYAFTRVPLQLNEQGEA